MKLASCLNKLSDLFSAEERASILDGAKDVGAVTFVESELASARQEVERIIADIAKAQGASTQSRKGRGENGTLGVANALTHQPAVNVHVNARPWGATRPPLNIGRLVTAAPPLVVTDRHGGRPLPRNLIGTVLETIGDVLRLGVPASAFDGLRSFYAKGDDTGAEYSVEGQSIGLSLDILEAQYRGSVEWGMSSVGNCIHELGHHISGDSDGTSFVAMSPWFTVRIDANGRRVAVGDVMREALDAYNADGELSVFLRYPLAQWQANTPARGLSGNLSADEMSIILQEEVFAQSWALYFTNPRLLKNGMPRTFSLMEGIAHGIRNTATIADVRGVVLEALRRRNAGVGTQVDGGTHSSDRAGARDGQADRGLGGRQGDVAARQEARPAGNLEHRYAATGGFYGGASTARSEGRGEGAGDGTRLREAVRPLPNGPVGEGTPTVTLREQQPDALTLVAIHHSQREGIDTLYGSMYGSATSRRYGEEYGRLQGKGVDRRTKQRVYFYHQEGAEIPPAEAAVQGGHVYRTKLTNILDPRSDTALRMFKEAGYVDGDLNIAAFERLVIERGYDGYVNISPNGRRSMIVVLGGNVPVEYLGPSTEVVRRRQKSLDVKSDRGKEIDRLAASLPVGFGAMKHWGGPPEHKWAVVAPGANRTTSIFATGRNREDAVRTALSKLGSEPFVETKEFEGSVGDKRPGVLEVRDEASPRNQARLDDFAPGNVSKILRKQNWAILTAENPNGRSLPPELNAKRNERLERDLRKLGVQYQKVQGKYGGNPETSFIVAGISPESATTLRDKYDQDSILTRRGLEHNDGSLTPATGVTEHTSEPEDYFSRVPQTGAMFTVDLAFDKRTAATVVPKSIDKHLTPEERAALGEGRGRVGRLMSVMGELPATSEVKHAALAGRAARGWYKRSRLAIERVYGADAPRFIALMAALSPQTDVRMNFYNTARAWHEWDRQGRPTSLERIARIFQRTLVTDASIEDGKNAMEAWTQNGTRALLSADPTSVILSGPKVESFRRNLMGDLREVTNDRHNAAFAGISQALFGGVKTKGAEVSGKGPGYIAFNVRVREAAAALSKETGETWHPAEVQETLWSFWKALYDLATAKGETRSALELLRSGALTHEMVRRVPDLGSFINDDEYQTIAGRRGRGDQADSRSGGVEEDADQGVARETGPVAATPATERIARRADRLIAARRRLERLNAEIKDQDRKLDAAGVERAAEIEALEDEIRRIEAEDRADDIPGFGGPRRPGTLSVESSVVQPLWYSRLEQALEKAPWSKAGDMPVGQLRMWVAARSKDGTLPADEVKWSGLLDYLDMYAEPKLRLPRSEVTSYLAQNGVRVEEVELGNGASEQDVSEVMAYNDMSDEQWDSLSVAEQERLIEEFSNDTGRDTYTKFSEYQLPGGKNYRELLLTLPTKPEDAGRFDLPADHNVYRPDPGNFPYRWRHEDADGNPIGPDFGVTPNTVAVAVRFAADRMHGGGRPNQQGGAFRSSHFDQPNILAHVRFNERRAADGSRVLFIEEIQSDWAQKGRKEGFRGERKTDTSGWTAEPNGDGTYFVRQANGTPANRGWAGESADDAIETLGQSWAKMNDMGPPFAPFVGKTEAWVALALKRMIRYAADNGFDAIAWTTGEQQADRYDLSKQVDNVRIAKYGGNAFDIQVRKGGDVVLSETTVNQGRIADLVGKDLADKAARQEDGTHKTYSGLDLKVGGEGMRAFYDKIVPNVANDLLKKMGGGRVGGVFVNVGGEPGRVMERSDGTFAVLSGSDNDVVVVDTFSDEAEANAVAAALADYEQPGFYLTDAIKPAARRPQALFAQTELAQNDVTQTPEFRAWFGDSKVVDEDGEPLVVYHGTEDAGFDEFESDDGEFYFTDSTDAAASYGRGRHDVYLSIKNPLVVDFNGNHWDGLVEGTGYGRSPERYVKLTLDGAIRRAKRLRKDGVIARNIIAQGPEGGLYEGRDAMTSYVVFRPEQIKSAIGNNGNFDAKRPSILESRSTVAERATEAIGDLLHTQRSFNLWDRTVGTQFHKAWKDPDFRKVYDGVQSYLNDASFLMTKAADLAPDVLPKLEGIRGILGATASKADIEAMSHAIFDGTLEDVVYTDDQLRSRGLSPKAIELYRQTRAAIDKSLTDVFTSEAVKEAKGLLPADVLARARREGDPWIVVDALSAIPVDQRSEVQQQVYDQLRKRVFKIEELKQKGYAPLMRFGQYTVHMADANGGSLSFTMHETEREANAVARALRAENPQHRVTQGVLAEDAWQLFQGISPDTLEIFAESVGASEKQLFQKYLKLATNNRSTLRRLIQRKKIPGFSPDAQRALAQFVTSNGRAASRNYNWGAVLKAANDVPKERGDVKDEAVRLAQYVQHPGEEAGGLRGLLFVQFLGGSIASALTNATQPILMTFPYLSRFGAAKAAAELVRAAKVAVGGEPAEADLRAAMNRASHEGIIAPHEVAGLYAESIRNLGSNLVVRRVLRAWGSLFSLAEAFNRRITFAAAYRLARDAGRSDPYQFAVNAIAETQGVYNRGNRPDWARGAVGATIFTFKQYSIAYVEFVRRLPPKQRALALAVLVLAAGLQGLPGADDLEDVLDTIAESLGYSWNSKKAMREWAIRTLGDSAGGLLVGGFSGLPGVPIDVQARLGLGNLIPGTGLLKRSNPDKGREVLEVFGPAGSQAKALVDAVGAAQEGNAGQVARSMLPLAIQNAMKAVDMVSTGYYSDTRGRRVIDVDAYEAAIKGIGVQPRRVGDVQRRRQDLQQDISLQRSIEEEVSDLWARGIIERDPSKVDRARAKLIDWNLTNPGSRVTISPVQIQRRVQQAAMTADQRFIKTAPPELRARVAEELR